MNIKVVVEQGEDGYFVAHVPALKNCRSQGKSREEALANIREATDLFLDPELIAIKPLRLFQSLAEDKNG